MTHPLPLERSREARLNHTQNGPIGHRTRPHAQLKDPAVVKLFPRAHVLVSPTTSALEPRYLYHVRLALTFQLTFNQQS